MILKANLIEYYQRGMSLSEIAQKLNCSVHRVSYWMNKYRIPRRNRSDAMYLKLNPNGDPFNIKEINSLEEAISLGFGLGIYWGEGNKVSLHSIRVANSDPRMIKFFSSFLLDNCGVKPEKLGFSIVCFNDSNVQEVGEYWSEYLGVPLNKFGKIVQIAPQGKGTYRRKSKHGVCTVTVTNIKLKRWIMDRIEFLSNARVV